MTTTTDLRSLSLWLDRYPGSLEPRPALGGDTDADVTIVGAGYTGLWTAYYLLQHDPGLRVLVLEKEAVGFGASGRNGGWCLGDVAAGPERHEARAGNDAARRMLRQLFATVDEVGRVAELEGIECDFAKGGSIRLARNGGQLSRQRAEVEHLQQAYGLTDADVRLLGPAEAGEQIRATGIAGATFTAHVAALHPAKLVRGLAAAVERHGGTIAERTTVRGIEPGRVITDRGMVRSEIVVRAVEGYTPTLDGHRRTLSPLYSLMVATEPLDEETWAEIGLADRQTFADSRHLVIYGQRTADGRIAFGGRGAPYGFGSKIDPAIERRSAVHDRVIATLVEMLPQLRGVDFTHRWGGVLGVPRNWFPALDFDPASGLAWAGGYVGEGVGAANLAGRTLADLICRVESERVDLPWVGVRSRRWEPEPLRWLAINTALRIMAIADRNEARTGRPSRTAAALWKLLR